MFSCAHDVASAVDRKAESLIHDRLLLHTAVDQPLTANLSTATNISQTVSGKGDMRVLIGASDADD